MPLPWSTPRPRAPPAPSSARATRRDCSSCLPPLVCHGTATRVGHVTPSHIRGDDASETPSGPIVGGGGAVRETSRMPHARRFRFGVQLHQPLPGLDWAGTARRVEELGYSTLFLPDHFGEQYAPIAAMA